jgi:hypothetical protein
MLLNFLSLDEVRTRELEEKIKVLVLDNTL